MELFGSGGWLGFGLGVGNTYISIVTSVTMEYPISGAMMVSRGNELFVESLKAMVAAHPDEITLWVDRTRVKKSDIKKIVKGMDINIPITVETQVKYTKDKARHHDNITATFHHMIKNAEHKVVIISDDDDFIRFDARLYAPIIYHNPYVGVIYGDARAEYSDGRTRIRRSEKITNPHMGNMMRGSCQVYNRDAFIEASKHIDINNKHLFKGELPEWFGYFLDWHPPYWLCRLGYTLMYTDKIFCIQNVNVEPTEDRKNLYGRWGEVCGVYDTLRLMGETS